MVASGGGDGRAARKAEHVRIALDLGDGPASQSQWEDIDLVHDALPDVDLTQVSLATTFLGYGARLPLVIAGMTGGYEGADDINRALARAAQEHGALIGVGSQRAALADPSHIRSYTAVREEAPDAFVIANVGINQLIDQDDAPGIGIDGALAAVQMVQADALAIHLNFLEEVVQPEGQTRARGGAVVLRELVMACPVPVIAKETGCGLSRAVAERVRAIGVRALDVGGRGGTSFTAIETARARSRGDGRRARIGEAFSQWGIPTAVCVVACAPVLPTIATGGIRSGVDAAKALALGATLVGIGRPLLECALLGEAAVSDWMGGFADELRTAAFLSGVAGSAWLPGAELVVRGATREWLTGSSIVGARP